MSEPNAEQIIKAAAKRKPDVPVAAPVVVAEPVQLSPVVANPFTDETGNSLADDGQRVN